MCSFGCDLYRESLYKEHLYKEIPGSIQAATKTIVKQRRRFLCAERCCRRVGGDYGYSAIINARYVDKRHVDKRKVEANAVVINKPMHETHRIDGC